MPRIRVLVVDDAVVMRKLISETLGRDPDLEVVGTAANGKIALQKITQVNPDIITLDVEMPEMDGLETLREIRKIYPRLPVIMFSTVTQRGAAATLDALSFGTSDYVTKPANVGSVNEAIERLEQDLIAKIKVHCRRPPAGEAVKPLPIFPTPPNSAPAKLMPIQIVCIGTSTGGPNALVEVFAHLPARLPVPLVIVQHMPPMFTALLAERLTAHSSVPCQEGAEGQLVECGRAYMAPGGRHMEVQRAGNNLKIRLQDEPPENSCRPAVDVLFRSVVAAHGSGVLGVVMTGMGQDGMRGCELIRAAHGHVLIQDEPTSVVWGMPGAVAQAGYANKVLALNQIAPAIARLVQESRRAT